MSLGFSLISSYPLALLIRCLGDDYGHCRRSLHQPPSTPASRICLQSTPDAATVSFLVVVAGGPLV